LACRRRLVDERHAALGGDRRQAFGPSRGRVSRSRCGTGPRCSTAAGRRRSRIPSGETVVARGASVELARRVLSEIRETPTRLLASGMSTAGVASPRPVPARPVAPHPRLMLRGRPRTKPRKQGVGAPFPWREAEIREWTDAAIEVRMLGDLRLISNELLLARCPGDGSPCFSRASAEVVSLFDLVTVCGGAAWMIPGRRGATPKASLPAARCGIEAEAHRAALSAPARAARAGGRITRHAPTPGRTRPRCCATVSPQTWRANSITAQLHAEGRSRVRPPAARARTRATAWNLPSMHRKTVAETAGHQDAVESAKRRVAPSARPARRPPSARPARALVRDPPVGRASMRPCTSPWTSMSCRPPRPRCRRRGDFTRLTTPSQRDRSAAAD